MNIVKMGVHAILLLLLLGTASAQESGEEELEFLEDNEIDLIKEENYTSEFEEDEEALLASDCKEEYEKKIVIESSEHCNDSKTCSYVVFLSYQTFWQAQRTCRCHSGQLATVSGWFVNSRIRNQVCAKNRYTPPFWIGLWKRNWGWRYSWIDGSSCRYRNWARRQPKRFRRNCVAMQTRSGKWFSSRCNVRRPFVCRI